MTLLSDADVGLDAKELSDDEVGLGGALTDADVGLATPPANAPEQRFRLMRPATLDWQQPAISSEELGARNAAPIVAMQSDRADEDARTGTIQPIGRLAGIARDIRNSPPGKLLLGDPELNRPGLASVPGAATSTVGKLGAAALGDVGGAVLDLPEEFRGNLRNFASNEKSGGAQPLDMALQAAREQEHDEGDKFGVATVTADIALGLAKMAPKVLAMPSGGLATSMVGSAALFGYDDQGKFHGKDAAFAALFPVVTGVTSKITDKAIAGAVERGATWLGNPGAQKAVHIAANQAAMNAVMVAQESPELLKLAQENPDEFKRQLAVIIGSNLAFAIPEAQKKFDPLISDKQIDIDATVRQNMDPQGRRSGDSKQRQQAESDQGFHPNLERINKGLRALASASQPVEPATQEQTPAPTPEGTPAAAPASQRDAAPNVSEPDVQQILRDNGVQRGIEEITGNAEREVRNAEQAETTPATRETNGKLSHEEKLAIKRDIDDRHGRLVIEERDDIAAFGKDSPEAKESAEKLRQFELDNAAWVGTAKRALAEGGDTSALPDKAPQSDTKNPPATREQIENLADQLNGLQETLLRNQIEPGKAEGEKRKAETIEQTKPELTPEAEKATVPEAEGETSTVQFTPEVSAGADAQTGAEMTAEAGSNAAQPSASSSPETPAKTPAEAPQQQRPTGETIPLKDQIAAAEKLVANRTNAYKRTLKRGSIERRDRARERMESAKAELKRLKEQRAFETRKARGFSNERLAADQERARDIIDDIKEHVGSFDYTKSKDEAPDWKPIGAARSLQRAGGRNLSTVLDDLHKEGLHRNLETADDLRSAINDAANVRKGNRKNRSAEEKQLDALGKQVENFERDNAKKPRKTQEHVVADDLNVGDEFTLNGAKMRVTDLRTADDGTVESVTLDDGERYGTQTVDGQTKLVVDKGTLEKAESGGQNNLQEPAGEFSFDAPESVSEQKAREKAENEKRKTELARQNMLARADARLTGNDVDTTSEMFGADTRTDKAGQGSLFEGGHHNENVALLQQYDTRGETQKSSFLEAARQPYQQEFDLSKQPAPELFQNGGQTGPLSREQLDAAQVRALTELTPEAFKEAFRQANSVAIVDPAKTPKPHQQYNIVGAKIVTPLDFVMTLLPLRSPYQETLKVAIVDASNRVLHSEILYTGTIDTISIRNIDFVRLMQNYGTAGAKLIFSHNHPGGDPTPGAADQTATRRLSDAARAAGFELGDHIVTNGRKYAVIDNFGDYTMHELPNPAKADWERMHRVDAPQMLHTDTFAKVADALRQSNPNYNHLVYLSTRMRVVAVERVPLGENIVSAFARNAASYGAAHVMADFSPKAMASSAHEDFVRLVRTAQNMDLKVIDGRWPGVTSARAQGYVSENAGNYVADQTTLNEPTAGEPREHAEIAAEFEAAAQELRDAIKLKWVKNRPPGMKPADAEQAIALATAKYRGLRDELLANDGYLEAQLLKLHELLQAKADQGDIEQVANELAAANPKQVASIREQLVNTGKLPAKETGKPIEYGRKLDELTDWLDQHPVESPQRSLLERLALARQFKERVQGIRDGFEWATAKLSAARKAFVEQWKSPPTDTPFRSLFKNWKFQDEWTGQEMHSWRKALLRQMPDKVRRAALSVWIDAGGDTSLVKFQRDAVPDRFREVWDAASKLTPSEQALGREIIANLARMKDDGLSSGLIERARDEYGMPQVWEKPPETGGPSTFAEREGQEGNAGNPTAKLDPRNPFFSFRREVPSYFDGIMAGGIPKSLDVGDLISNYHLAFHKSLNSRAFIAMARNERAADGSPLVKISGTAAEVPFASGGKGYVVMSGARPADAVTADGRPYQPIDHWAMKDWKLVFKDSAGKPIMVRGDMLVHPDHFDFLNNELGESALRDGVTGRLLQPIQRTNAYLKASKLAIAGFHLMTIAEHMASHLESPLTNGFKIDLRDPTQALLVRHGLELGMGGNHAAFMEGVASHGGLFRQVPGLGDFMAKTSDWMFKDYIPTIMMKVGVESFNRNLKRYGKELTRDQIAELTATQMNAGGGLLNYRQLGRNKTLMDLSRMALLAPMFLEARGRVLAQALKPYHAEQRRLLLVQAVGLFVAARVLNALLDKDPHWEERNWFSVVNNGRAYSLRTIVGDVFHLLNDPNSFASGRLSPVARTLIEAGTGRDLRTGANIQTYFEKKIPRTLEIAVRDVISWLAPVGVEGVLPDAKAKETTLASAALTSVGVGSRKELASARVYDWAKEFNRTHDDKSRAWQQRQDMEIRSETPYRKLDNLLEAEDWPRAFAEYQLLQKQGHSAADIRARFKALVTRPFTGTIAREADFRAGLDDHQREVYRKAKEERQQRRVAFGKMLQQAAGLSAP